MNDRTDRGIEIEAAQALVHWKALFADEVAFRARQFAAEAGQPGNVTLSHYRQAAQIAISLLSAAILTDGAFDGDQKAA